MIALLRTLAFGDPAGRGLARPRKSGGVACRGGDVRLRLTDIEHSTALWTRWPEAMRDALDRADEVVAGPVIRFGGVAFQHTGDGKSWLPDAEGKRLVIAFDELSFARPNRTGRTNALASGLTWVVVGLNLGG